MAPVGLAIVEDFHPEIVARIRQAVPPDWVLRLPADASLAERTRVLSEADAAFVMASPLPAELLIQAPRLRFVQKLGIGVDRIDLDACVRQAISVARLQASNALPVAEHALLLILASLRRLPLSDRRTREGAWDKEQARGVNRQLSGKRLGIVGFGAIGRTLTRLVSGFDLDIVYFDPVRAAPDVENSLGVVFAPLEGLIASSDIVSLHLPLSPSTQMMMNAERLGLMKRGAVLINTARGGLVDEAALVELLRSGHLFAAGIDAFASEPPIGSALLTLDQTVVTPHFAGATIDNFNLVIERAVDNTRRYFAGEPIPEGDRVQMPAPIQ